jgi:hypothetical protein
VLGKSVVVIVIVRKAAVKAEAALAVIPPVEADAAADVVILRIVRLVIAVVAAIAATAAAPGISVI